MDRVEELLEFERTRLMALVSGDVDRAAAMHHPDYELVTPRGVPLSSSEYLEEISSGRLRYVRWEPAEMRGRIIGDVGAIRYRSRIEMISTGTALPPFECRHTGVYERIDGRWLAVMSHATAIVA